METLPKPAAVDLARFRDRFGERFTVGLVVHTGVHTLALGPRLWAVPVSALWRDDPSNGTELSSRPRGGDQADGP